MSFFNREFPKRRDPRTRFMGPLSDDQAFQEFDEEYVPEPIYPHRPPTVAELILQLHNLKLKSNAQEQEIAELKVKIRQQAETIRIHSKEISKPHVDKGAVTPFRGYSQAGGNTPNVMNEPPPVFNPATQTTHLPHPNTMLTKWGPISNYPSPAPQPPLGFPSSNPTGSAPRPYTPLGQMTGLSSPMGNLNLDSRRNFDASIAGTPPRTLQPPIGTPTKSGTPATSAASSQEKDEPSTPPNQIQRNPAALGTSFLSPVHLISSAIVPTNSGPVHKIAVKWNELFDMVVRYAYNHLNTPSNLMDSKLPQELKDKFMSAATSTTAARLLGKQDTRYLLIARILIEWILRVCFQPNILEGLDLDVDEAISRAKYTLARTPPEDHRFVIIEQIQNCFEILTKHDEYDNFIRALSISRATEFLEFIQPLKWAGNTNHQQDALNIIIAAHKLQALQLIESMEFRAFFTVVGDPFDTARMVNMDNVFGNMLGPEIMVRKGTVKLTVVPQIMSRTNEDFGPSVTKVLVKAGVLLKFKDQMVSDLAQKR